MFKCNKSMSGGVTVFTLQGSLDAISAKDLKQATEETVTEGTIHLVFDLGELELIDSSGVGAIVSALKRVVKLKDPVSNIKGDLKLACLAGQPAEIFQLLRLDRAFQIFKTVDDAVNKFSA